MTLFAVAPAFRLGLSFVWRTMMFAPCTITLFSLGIALVTSPRLPLSLPEITSTRSPFFTLSLMGSRGALGFNRGILKHLRGQRHDLHEIVLAQLARDRAE